MSVVERRKGADGKRELVALLRAHGWPRAHRNFGWCSADGAYVVSGPEGAVLEVKRHRGRLVLPRATRQAEEVAGAADTPIVGHRRDGTPWRTTLPLEDLLELLAERDRG